SLPGAYDAVMRPHRNPSPFPLFDDLGVGFLDQCTQPAEHLTPPVAQLLDSRIYQPGWSFIVLPPTLFHVSHISRLGTACEPSANTSIHPHVAAVSGDRVRLRDSERGQRSRQFAARSPSR